MIIKEILSRKSVREYKSDPVSDEHILEIIKAAHFAPTAKNNQALEFIVVKDQKTKDDLFNILGQEFLKQAPVLIIPTTDTEKTTCPVQDLSVASENIFLQAASFGLGSVWKNVAEDTEIKNLLAIPEKFKVINIIPIGYPKEEIASHQDKVDDYKIHQEKW